MGILVDRHVRVAVYGSATRLALRLADFMRQAGTEVVGFVSSAAGAPGDLRRFADLRDAAGSGPIDAALVLVPGHQVKAAVREAVEAEVRLLVVMSEGVPLHDLMVIRRRTREAGVWMVGPNSSGIATVGKAVIGLIPTDSLIAGPVGLLARSGTLIMAAAEFLTRNGIGVSSCVSAGGEMVLGRNLREYLELFDRDPATKAVVLLGEVGSAQEEEAAEVVARMGKPVVAYIAGRHAPTGRRLGHAGAFIDGERGRADGKRAALAAAGAEIVDFIWETPEHLKAFSDIPSYKPPA